MPDPRLPRVGVAEASFPWAPGKPGNGTNSRDQEGRASNSDQEKPGGRKFGGSCLQFIEEQLGGRVLGFRPPTQIEEESRGKEVGV